MGRDFQDALMGLANRFDSIASSLVDQYTSLRFSIEALEQQEALLNEEKHEELADEVENESIDFRAIQGGLYELETSMLGTITRLRKTASKAPRE